MTQIVTGTPEQLEALTAIEEISFSDPWSAQALAGAMADPDCCFLTALEDGAAVGYCIVHSLYEQADLYSVAVHPDHRRRGIAGALLDRGFAWAKQAGAERVFLEVRAGNGEARSLYEQMGFVPIALRKKYYTAPVEDAVIMEKTL